MQGLCLYGLSNPQIFQGTHSPMIQQTDGRIQNLFDSRLLSNKRPNTAQERAV
jgi:hypothetical protein